MVRGEVGGQETLEVMAKFMGLIVVIALQVYSYLQTQQVAYIKYIQLSVCQSDLQKVFCFLESKEDT